MWHKIVLDGVGYKIYVVKGRLKVVSLQETGRVVTEELSHVTKYTLARIATGQGDVCNYDLPEVEHGDTNVKPAK